MSGSSVFRRLFSAGQGQHLDWLIAGLGNPGPRYRHTRHNAGALALDTLAGKVTAPPLEPRFKGKFCSVTHAGCTLGLLKPATFMNRSGQSVAAAVKWGDTPLANVLILHDDVDLPFGALRLKKGGGLAGHNGLKSVAASLKSSDFGRLRIGVGRPGPGDNPEISDFVLSDFSGDEAARLLPLWERVAEAVLHLVSEGYEAAMTRLNGVEIP